MDALKRELTALANAFEYELHHGEHTRPVATFAFCLGQVTALHLVLAKLDKLTTS